MKYTWKWPAQAKAGLRAVDLDARTGHGDVHALHGSYTGCLRLRVGDGRVLFREVEKGTFEIAAVEHRSEAYR